MRIHIFINGFVFLLFLSTAAQSQKKQTVVQISGDQFRINGELTYKNKFWNRNKVEGLLMNSRMVQGIFDDLNPKTVNNWAYPDTKKWDANRNTNEFTKSLKQWRKYGLLSFTLNMQGGSPYGYSSGQPWHNSAYFNDGRLRSDYMKRLEKILVEADRLGMVPILGLFYFGQDERLNDEQAIINAVNNIIEWLLKKNFKNVLIEINNECNIQYDHEILRPSRVHELINLVKNKKKNGYRYYAGTSYGGGTIPLPNVVKSSDFILLHGNGVSNPDSIESMVKKTRQVEGYQAKPILFNEDDHFDFDKQKNNMTAALKSYASWGYFDYRFKNEAFEDGFQSVPVDWNINSYRKKQFFNLLGLITGTYPVN